MNDSHSRSVFGRDVVGTLEVLMDIASPTGTEAEIGGVLASRLLAEGFRVKTDTVDGDRINVLATGTDEPTVLFCTHMDTVRPHLPCSQQDGVIYGRGACDAKGAMAAMLVAACELKSAGIEDVGVLFVVGEETNSDGARAAAASGLRVDYIVLGEPTQNRLAAGQKGTLVFRLAAKGVAGHSAYPEFGRSAIHRLIPLMKDWIDHDWGSSPKMGLTTLNFGTMHGGVGANVFAPEVVVEGIFRVSTSLKEVKQQIEPYLTDDLQFSVVSEAEPLELFCPSGFESEVVSFGSDAPFLNSIGQVLMMGPGSIEYAHRDNEQVKAVELEEAVRHYIRLGRMLSRGRES
ncbi:MAG: M20/M25/M40 family metallo-hydrolase [Acidobacteriota bacterium]|nr:MAG: M20/M25/M40 family metallo-hydrolase [Acidobacteriota bacterium]